MPASCLSNTTAITQQKIRCDWFTISKVTMFTKTFFKGISTIRLKYTYAKIRDITDQRVGESFTIKVNANSTFRWYNRACCFEINQFSSSRDGWKRIVQWKKSISSMSTMDPRTKIFKYFLIRIINWRHRISVADHQSQRRANWPRHQRGN